MTQIKTKWHVFKQCFLDRQLLYPAPKGGKGQYCDEFGMSNEAFVHFIEGCDRLPKFVFSETLATAFKDEKQVRSLIDLKNAGLLKLPYPAMLVESPHFMNPAQRGTGNSIVMLFDPNIEEGGYTESEYDVGGVLMSTHKDADGEYACVAPCISVLSIHEGVDEPDLKLSAIPTDWYTRHDMEGQHYMGSVFQRCAEGVGMAWFFTMLVMQTRGVEPEVIETVRLNKSRKASGKISVPHHTFIKIGHVYNKDGTKSRFDSRK